VIWPTVALGEVCKTGSGGTPNRSNKSYYSGDIPWIKSGELGLGLVTKSEEHISQLALSRSSAKLIPPGAILLAMYGATIGKLAELGIEASTNQAICHIIPEPKLLEKSFLFHFLQFSKSSLIGRGAGGAQPNISQQIIRETVLPLPPLAEQKRIAAILDKADDMRRQRRAALNLLDTLAQSIFVEMFGDPVTNPKRWPSCPLGQIINFKGGSQPAKTNFIYEPREGYVRLIQIRDFRTDEYPTYVPQKLAKRPFEKDDVMVGRYGPPVFQIFRGLSGTYNVALMKAEPVIGIEKEFVFALLKERNLHSYVVSNSERTAGQSGVNLELLENYPAYRPSATAQNQFCNTMGRHFAIGQSLNRSIEKSDALFASLQSRAFAGEL
jgi:type I restriction enzyme S subunit